MMAYIEDSAGEKIEGGLRQLKVGRESLQILEYSGEEDYKEENDKSA